jgi:hypothetical protein
MIRIAAAEKSTGSLFVVTSAPLSSSNNTALDRREPTMGSVRLGLATLLSSRWGTKAET